MDEEFVFGQSIVIQVQFFETRETLLYSFSSMSRQRNRSVQSVIDSVTRKIKQRIAIVDQS